MYDKNSYFLRLAKTGKRISALWWAIAVAFVVVVGGQFLGLLVFGVLVPTGVFGEPVSLMEQMQNPAEVFANFNSYQQGLVLAVTTFGAIMGVFLWIALYEKRPIGTLGFSKMPDGLIKFLRGGLFAVLAMSLMAFGLKALGFAQISETQLPQSWLQLWPLLILLIGWSIQGSSEEIVFRGLLFQSISARHNLLIGVALSSVLFSLLHSMNANPSALFFVNLVVFSLFACFYVLREGGLWGICGFHALWNFAQGNLYGFAVSGEQFGADRWMSFRETGPDLITGGATGPEGGLVTTAALGLCTALVLLIQPPKDFPYAEKASSPSA